MSTYLYLECASHDPPLRSDDEVGQHLTDLPAIRYRITQRALYAGAAAHNLDITTDSSFARTAIHFLTQHPHCEIRIRDEYGEEHPLRADD